MSKPYTNKQCLDCHYWKPFSGHWNFYACHYMLINGVSRTGQPGYEPCKPCKQYINKYGVEKKSLVYPPTGIVFAFQFANVT